MKKLYPEEKRVWGMVLFLASPWIAEGIWEFVKWGLR